MQIAKSWWRQHWHAYAMQCPGRSIHRRTACARPPGSRSRETGHDTVPPKSRRDLNGMRQRDASSIAASWSARSGAAASTEGLAVHEPGPKMMADNSRACFTGVAVGRHAQWLRRKAFQITPKTNGICMRMGLNTKCAVQVPMHCPATPRRRSKQRQRTAAERPTHLPLATAPHGPPRRVTSRNHVKAGVHAPAWRCPCNRV